MLNRRAGGPRERVVEGESGLFNPLADLTLEPRAGLLCVDFNHGDLLSLATRAEIGWRGDVLASFTGAERLLRF